MDEQHDYKEVKKSNGRTFTTLDRYHQITIVYSPENVSGLSGQIRSNEDQRECSVIIRGAVNAQKVFHDLIQQIREQMPDQLYLDTALERMISGTSFETIEKQDNHDHWEMDMHEISFKKKTTKKKAVKKPKAKKRK